MGVAAAMALARRRLAEDALELDLAVAIDVPAGRAAGCAVPHRLAILRQLGKTRAEAGIDVAVDHFRGRFDMGVGIVYPQPVLHRVPPSLALFSIHPAAPRWPRKMLDPGLRIA